MTRLPWTTACVGAAMLVVSAPAAHAVEAVFDLDSERSQLIVCLGFGTTPRLFLDGTLTIDFDDTDPVPAAGMSAAEVTDFSIAGTLDPVPGFFIEGLEIAEVAGTPTTGFVDGDTDPDTIVLDRINLLVTGAVQVPLFGINLNLEDQAFLETGAMPFDDLVAPITAPDGTPCDLDAGCVLDNSGDAPVPSQTDIDLACAFDTLCGPDDFCLGRSFEFIDPFGNPASIPVEFKWVLRAQSRCIDFDGDGFSAAGGDCGPLDCNDLAATAFPGGTETGGNLIDEDCDGTVVDPILCSPARGARSGPWQALPMGLAAVALGLARRRHIRRAVIE